MEQSGEPMQSISGMTVVHRIIAQILISKRILVETELMELFQKVCRDKGGKVQVAFHFKVSNGDWGEHLTVLNRNLAFVFMEIRRATSETDGRVYWCLVNARSDAIAQSATTYTPAEIDLFKRIVILSFLSY